MAKRLSKPYFLPVSNKSFDRVEGSPKQKQFYELNCWKPCPLLFLSRISLQNIQLPDFTLTFLRPERRQAFYCSFQIMSKGSRKCRHTNSLLGICNKILFMLNWHLTKIILMQPTSVALLLQTQLLGLAN